MDAGRSLSAVANRLVMAGVAAAVVAAAGAGWCYWHDAGAVSAGARPIVVARMASPDLFQAVPDGEDRRRRAPYPIEFERQFPLLAAAELPDAVPILPPRGEARPVTAKGVQAVHAGCGTRCAHVAAVPTPPRRPDALRAAPDAVTIVAETVVPERPMRVLGVALPYLPTGQAVLQTVVDLRTDLTTTMAAMIETSTR